MCRTEVISETNVLFKEVQYDCVHFSEGPQQQKLGFINYSFTPRKGVTFEVDVMISRIYRSA